MNAELEAAFPKLRDSPYNITSPPDSGYNCVARAARDSTRFWWPAPGYFWPAEAPLEETLNAFREAYARLGFVDAESPEWEAGFEKVAIFADEELTPTHAARQIISGRWTSKLGVSVDIEHELPSLEGSFYGRVVLVLKRPVG